MPPVMWNRWRSFIRRLFGSTSNRYSTVGTSSPIINDTNIGNAKLTIHLHQTELLYRANGRIPEDVAAVFIERALVDAGYNVEITFNNRLVRGGTSRNDLTNDDHTWWAQYPKEDKPSQRPPGIHDPIHMLFVDRDGGGMSIYKGRYSLTGVKSIDRVVDWTKTGVTRLHDNIRATLHEIGHDLGATHGDNIVQRPSMLYTDTAKDAFSHPAP